MPARALGAATPYRVVLLAFGLAVLGLFFREFVTLLVALVFTTLVAIPLSAFADRLERRGVPRPIGALLGLLLALVFIAALAVLLIPPFVDQVKRFADDVPSLVDQIHRATGASQHDIGRHAQSFVRGYTDHPSRLLGSVASLGAGVAGVVGALVLIAVTAYFVAVSPAPLVAGALRLLPPDRRDAGAHVMNRVRSAWIGWMKGTLIKTVIVGVLLYAGLTVLGVDFALLLAVFTAVLVTIPYFGGAIAIVPAALLGLTYSPSKAALVVVLYLLVLQLEGNIIVPLVMARTVKLHPALIAVGVVAVGELLGFLGLFVAIPILSLAVILVDELWVDRLEARS